VKYIEYIFTFLFLLFSQFCLSQELNYTQYTTEDGLPSNTVYEIVQDSNGLIWMGTENGLVSFDGVSFERFSDPRLKDNDIIELEISKDGIISFINLSGQYCRMNELDLDIVAEFKNGKNSDILRVEEREFVLIKDNSTIPMKIDIYEFKDNELELVTDLKLLKDTKDSNDLRGDKYLRTDLANKVRLMHSGHFQISKGLGPSYCKFKLLQELDNYFFSDGLTLRKVDVDFGLFLLDINSYIRSIEETEKQYFISTTNGLIIFDKESSISRRHFKNIRVNTIFEDLESNLWVSTEGSGLIKVKNLNIKTISLSAEESAISDILNFGNLTYVLTLNSLYVYDDNYENKYTYAFKNSSFKRMVHDGTSVWVVDNGLKFHKFGLNDKVCELGFDKGSMGAKFVTILNDQIFLSGNSGFYKINIKDLVCNTTNLNLVKISNKLVTSFILDSLNNKFYCGTRDGLFQYGINGGQEQEYLEDKSIVTLQPIKNQKFWVGTANSGMYEYENSIIVDSLNIDSGLLSNVIFDIEKIDDLLLIGTGNGLVKYNLESQEVSIFNSFDGLLSDVVSDVSIGNKKVIKINQGNKFCVIDFEELDIFKGSPKMYLDKVYLNNVEIDHNVDERYFEYDENKIELFYNFISFRSNGIDRMKYKISSLDSNWTFQEELILRLPALSQGKYRIEAVGIMPKNKETKKLVTQFTILPPWWQTVWARLLAILTIGLSIYLVFKRRNQRLIREETAKRESLIKQEASKREYLKQINSVKDQALQLQMNPHFIFNAMNAIQNFITSNREESATLYLAKFANLIRKIFDYSSQNLINLEKEIEFVKLYLDLEKLRFKDKVSCDLLISDEINDDKDILKVPPLMVQPILENSFKHGLFHKDGQGNLKVSYDIIDSTLHIVVEDDGVGRGMSIKEGASDRKSSGLQNIRERLNILKFNNTKGENSMEIIDLYNNGNPSGTRTILKITIGENEKTVS